MKTEQVRPAATARRLAAVLGLSAIVLGLWSAPALAHARLVESTPAAGADPAESPEQVRLRFSEPVEAEFGPLEVYDAGGERVDADDARVTPDDARVVLATLEELPEGSYTVEWRVTSIDGHVVDGTYEFAVGAPETAGESGGEEAAARPSGEKETRQGAGLSAGRLAILGFVFVSMAALVTVVLKRRQA